MDGVQDGNPEKWGQALKNLFCRLECIRPRNLLYCLVLRDCTHLKNRWFHLGCALPKNPWALPR